MALYPSCISSTFIFILIDRKGTQFASRIIVAHSSHSPFDWPCKAMKLRNGFQAMLTTAYILTIPSSQTLCETLFTCAIFDDISINWLISLFVMQKKIINVHSLAVLTECRREALKSTCESQPQSFMIRKKAADIQTLLKKEEKQSIVCVSTREKSSQSCYKA